MQATESQSINFKLGLLWVRQLLLKMVSLKVKVFIIYGRTYYQSIRFLGQSVYNFGLICLDWELGLGQSVYNFGLICLDWELGQKQKIPVSLTQPLILIQQTWLLSTFNLLRNFSIVSSITIFSVHLEQQFALSWALRWISRWSFRLKCCWQWPHWWGFSSRCVFKCWFKFDLDWKIFSHSEQGYSWPCCCLMCLVSAERDDSCVPHSWQICLLISLLCVLSCWARCFLKLKVFGHLQHLKFPPSFLDDSLSLRYLNEDLI